MSWMPKGLVTSLISNSAFFAISRLLWLIAFLLLPFSTYAATATTNPPLSIGQTAVNLTGTIGSGSGSVSVRFVYGTSLDLVTLSTPGKNYFVSGQSLDVSQFVSGLSCSTQYFFQLEAVDSSGVSISPVNSFVTNPCVQVTAQVETLEVTNISASSTRLVGFIATSGTEKFNRIQYYFEYGLSASYGEKTQSFLLPAEGSLQKTLTQDLFYLQCGENYHYRLVVEFENLDQSVEAVQANDSVFSTKPCLGIDILYAGRLSIGKDFVSLGGTVNSPSDSVSIYFAYGNSQELLNSQTDEKSLGTGVVTFSENITELECESTYFFQLVVVGSETEVRSDIKSFETRPCSLPPSVTTLPPLELTQTSAKMQASVVANDESTDVFFQWGSTSALELQSSTSSISGGQVGQLVYAVVDNLQCNTEYFFQPVVENVHGKAVGETQSFTTLSCEQPPGSPGGTTLTPIISAGGEHSVALGRSGEILSWGSNDSGQLGAEVQGLQFVDGVKSASEPVELMYGFIDAAAGARHTVVLNELGDVFSFGDNTRGQLGAETEQTGVNYPVYAIAANLSSDKVIAVDAGDSHSLALTATGFVYVWGSNLRGQLLDASLTRSSVPILVDTLQHVSAISAGDDFNIVLTTDKGLLGWGDNQFGQLANNNFEPTFSLVAIPTTEEVTAISAGKQHVLALTGSGKVLSWGGNEQQQLGRSENEREIVPDYVHSSSDVSILSDVIQIAAGADHSLALLENGTVMAWGSNQYQQSDISSTALTVNTPQFVTNPDGSILQNIVAISAGNHFSIVVNTNGEIFSWGNNAKGQLDGSLSANNFSRLKTANDSLVSLAAPHFVIDMPEIALQSGEAINIRVRLSAAPFEAVTVSAQLEGVAGVLEAGDTTTFTTENWFEEVVLTLRSNSDGGASNGHLQLSANGLESISVPITIEEKKVIVPKQTVGFIFQIEFVLYLLILTGFRYGKKVTYFKR